MKEDGLTLRPLSDPHWVCRCPGATLVQEKPWAPLGQVVTLQAQGHTYLCSSNLLLPRCLCLCLLHLVVQLLGTGFSGEHSSTFAIAAALRLVWLHPLLPMSYTRLLPPN